MDQWLRPVFTRTRTPVSSITSDRDCDRDRDYNRERSEETSKETHLNIQPPTDEMKSMRPSSRVSSYMGFRSSASIPTPTITNPPNAHIYHPPIVPENVYYKPSGSQMAETLKTVMMTRNLMESVPVEYNSCIMHVLEAYNDLEVKIVVKEREVEEIRERLERDIREFEGMAEGWKAKEKDYQKEIKNLEILLSKMEGGMENVTMARSKSIVHGARRAADLFEDGMEKIKQNFARYSSGRGSAITTADWEIEHLPPHITPSGTQTQTQIQTFETQTPTNTSYFEKQEDNFTQYEHQQSSSSKPRREKSRSSIQDTESFHSAIETQPPSRLTSVQLDALERQHAEEELGVVFDSSSESDDTSSRSAFTDANQAVTPGRTPKHMGMGIGIATGTGTGDLFGIRNNGKEKPLPDIPTAHSDTDPFSFAGNSSSPAQLQPWVDTFSQSGNRDQPSLESDSKKGFSFNEGDDTPSMLQNTSKYFLDRKVNTISTIPMSRLSYVLNNEDEFVVGERLGGGGTSGSGVQSRMTITERSDTPLSTQPRMDQGVVTGVRMGLRQELGMGMEGGLGRPDGVERGDSMSSIVTAVRYDSGKGEGGRAGRGKGKGKRAGNESGGMKGNANVGGKEAKKGNGNGSGTAVTAAVRAFTASNNNNTNSSNNPNSNQSNSYITNTNTSNNSRSLNNKTNNKKEINERMQAWEMDGREGVPFSPERSPEGSNAE